MGNDDSQARKNLATAIKTAKEIRLELDLNGCADSPARHKLLMLTTIAEGTLNPPVMR